MQIGSGVLTRFDSGLLRVLDYEDSPLSLGQLVQELGVESGEQVNVESVITDDGDPLRAIRPRSLPVLADAVKRGVHYLVVPDKLGDFVLSAWPTGHDGVFNLMASVPVTDPRWSKVERWIGRATPKVVPCFLNHEDFLDIGKALAIAGDVEVSRLSARNLLDQSSTTRGWKSRSDGLRPSPLEAIAEVEASFSSVRTMTLRVANVLNVHLRRLAGATFYSGNFYFFDRVVLTKLATAVSSRRVLMTNRERQVGRPVPAPISIRLPGAFFGREIGTGEVVETLESLSHTSVAVLHRNPYLHVVVTDYSDGSNFDVFVTGADAIDIHPGFRSSMGALTRLSQRLGERFMATDISEAADEPEISLDDLVASR